MSTRIKRNFDKQFYSNLVSFALSDEQSGQVASESCHGDVKGKSQDGSLLIFTCNSQVYLFELMLGKGQADINYICDEELFSLDKNTFINNLLSNDVLSTSGSELALGRIDQSQYILGLSKELSSSGKKMKTQKEVMFREVQIFKIINVLDNIIDRGDALKRIKKSILNILKFELKDELNEQAVS